MNDATRELGAALGIAVLGSVAASRYDGRIAKFLHGLTRRAALDGRTRRSRARCASPARCRTARRCVLTAGSKGAFVSGLHLAALRGRAARPVRGRHRATGTCRTRSCRRARCTAPVESMEDMAEFGISGGLPVFADVVGDGDASCRNDRYGRDVTRAPDHQAPRYAAAAR